MIWKKTVVVVDRMSGSVAADIMRGGGANLDASRRNRDVEHVGDIVYQLQLVRVGAN